MDRRGPPATHWQTSSLAALGTEIKGGLRPSPGRQYVLYSVPAFPSGQPEIVEGNQIGSSKRLVLHGDLLLCKINPRINRVWSVGPSADGAEQLASTEYLVLRPHDPRVLPWLVWYLRSPRFRSWIKANVEGATGSHTRAKSAAILKQHVPLAPQAERSRIVSFLDHQMSRLEIAARSLDRARSAVAIYRAAVLAYVADGRDRLGRASVRGSERDVAGSHLPGGLRPEWRRVTIGAIATVHIGSTPSRRQAAYWGGEIPWVSSGEVRFRRIDATRECLTEQGYRSSSVDLHPAGTVLLAMIGEGRTRGQAAILDIPAATNQNVAAIRLTDPEATPEWLFYVLMAAYQRTRTLGSGNNQPALSKSRVSAIEVPLPPKREQLRLVSELEARLSMLDAIDAQIRACQRRHEVLSQMLLRMAFDGELDVNHRHEVQEWP